MTLAPASIAHPFASIPVLTMASVAPPLPDVRLSFGPMLIGVFFNMILYGVSSSYRSGTFTNIVIGLTRVSCRPDDDLCPNVQEVSLWVGWDAIWMKLFLSYLFVVETANTGMDMGIIYEPLILHYGILSREKHPSTFQPVRFRIFFAVMQLKPCYFRLAVFMAQPLCVVRLSGGLLSSGLTRRQVLISMPVQLFFAWRIRQLTKAVWLPVLIALLALSSFAGGLWTSVEIQILRLFAKKPLLHHPALVWFLTSCVADVLITVTLVITLSRKKTGFTATDSVLDRIIRMTIQTGAATALFSILDVVCFMVLPHYAVNFIWDLALSKLYSNCLLSTLNARAKLNSASHGSTYQQHQPRGYVISPRGSGKDSFLDAQAKSGFPNDPLEYGIRMTKVVERMQDPLPGSTADA
ncbi:unnamed protein product [Mycena citricolor]|uniref:DUF6534 domain-containing protein n=1 Tax=Mycena citricolor TaxID=2018698 RepID=A0AAD2GZS4_9AGAR|nr:unnamed protein product [Mycena citricolor]